MQIAQTDILAQRIFIRKSQIGEFPGNHADFAERIHIILIKKTAAEDHESADFLKALGDAYQTDWTTHTVNDEGHRHIVRARDYGHVRQRRFGGFHVAQGNLVAQGDALGIAGVNQFGVNQIHANTFNLADDVAFSHQSHGHYQHDAGAADDHTKHRERRAHLVGAQFLQRQTPRLRPEDRCGFRKR